MEQVAPNPSPKPKKKFNKRWLFLIIPGGILFLVVAVAGGMFLFLTISRQNRRNTDPIHVDPPSPNGLVFAKGRSLYDANGDILRLKGTNAGNILVTEGWISPFSCGPKLDKDGNVVCDKDGNVEYPELTQEEYEEGLLSNPNLTDEQRADLMNVYYEHWFSKDDFKRVKNVFGMNAIRLPFYWRNILDYNQVTETYSRKPEEEAFKYLDWFVQQCYDNDIYLILDLHGAPVTQNGYEHSGTITSKRNETLWFNEKAINATADLWSYVASHYKDKEIGKAIATYDILNEPCSDGSETLSGSRCTNEHCYPVFDKIYKAIRNTGDEHNITIEGVWSYSNFENPAKYGWTNIQYEVHFYNWFVDSGLTYELFYDGMEFTRIGHDFEVPYYVGEFSFFSDYGAWNKWLSYYDQMGYSWTIWSYKKTVVGFWDDSWGLYNYRLYLDNKTHQQKVNAKTANYADIKAAFECSNTTNCYVSNLGNFLIDYLHR